MDNRNVVMSGCVDMAPKLEEQCVPSSLALKKYISNISSVTQLPPVTTAT